MRIDTSHGPQPSAESERSSPQGSAAGAGVSAGSAPGGILGEDQAQLSGAHTQVAALAAQASQLPEVRQERVQSLRQAVESGNYYASPDEVAGAIVTHLIGFGSQAQAAG